METTAIKLVRLYLSGRFAPAAEEKLQRWLLEDCHPEEKEYASLQYWNELKTTPTRQTYAALERVKQRVGIPLNSFVPPIGFMHKWRVIAALVLFFLLAGGGYLWFTSIPAGGYTEISVAYGDSKYLLLPDGSELWVNAGTTVRYPDKFNTDRNIYLSGEAYFSVKPDEKHPFVVHTEHLTVSVLGTVFNLRAYAEDAATVATLETGRVKIDAGNGETHLLVPGEQLRFNNRTSEISVSKVSSTDATAWKEGQLVFMESTLNEIFQVLCRRFNLTVLSQVPQSDIQYTIRFTGEESIGDILNVLSEISGYSLGMENQTITVSRR